MNALNQILLEGNVVKTPERRTTANGKYVCTVRLAVNHSYLAQSGATVEEVSYFDVETFGYPAEHCAERYPKGRKIYVAGRLKQSRWKDAEGKAHSKVYIVADHINAEAVRSPRQDKDRQQTAAMLAETAAASYNQPDEEEVVF